MPDLSRPGEKTIFKINSATKSGSKPGLVYSKNTPEGCAYCLAPRKEGQPPLPLCLGCRSVRFCNKEHQVAFWPEHKSYCKQQIKNQEAIARINATSSLTKSGFPSVQERKLIVEDWVELHRLSLIKACASALHTAEKPFDWKNQHVLFVLSYRKDSDGNPSSAFELDDAYINENPPVGTNSRAGFDSISELLDNPSRRSRDAKDSNYIGIVPCLFHFDREYGWITGQPCYKRDLNLSQNHDDWVQELKFLVMHGLVYRVRSRTLDGPVWLPGFVEKKDNKWVWEEKSLESLKAKGINVSAIVR
ncbi:hypothetical protein SISNIDRAFT_456608 [Sistotremastrum niveocremeum HHB9708]|uniref:MYND-type domain-containing protein n=1 Tax=Sistotremastrum niveocremeum HHB9708 TaxID=1314777 RepID=A0A164SPG6_9AGAM|nr:hypothetical protein SISNIDRAFT_456608 [Sistotremastrum niveocremeum HHB9708]